MRGGRTVKISIYDVVVGDVVPLKIGDQVGHSVFLQGIDIHVPWTK